jgi:hypothetical protein
LLLENAEISPSERQNITPSKRQRTAEVIDLETVSATNKKQKTENNNEQSSKKTSGAKSQLIIANSSESGLKRTRSNVETIDVDLWDEQQQQKIIQQNQSGDSLFSETPVRKKRKGELICFVF